MKAFGLWVWGLPAAEKTYLFGVPHSGFYIKFLKKVGFFGPQVGFRVCNLRVGSVRLRTSVSRLLDSWSRISVI